MPLHREGTDPVGGGDGLALDARGGRSKWLVPFAALDRSHDALRGELVDAFRRTLDANGFILGAELEAFEGEFAAYCELPHCVGVASGTAALSLALRALGVGPGDEVVVPAHTYIATALAVAHVGAVP